MTTCAPPDPFAVALAMAQNAHRAGNMAELQRVLVQDSLALVPADHVALIVHEQKLARATAIGHREEQVDELAVVQAVERIAPHVGRHGHAVVAVDDGSSKGLEPGHAAAIAAALRAAGHRCAVAIPLAHRGEQLGSLLLLFRGLVDAERARPLLRTAPLFAAALAARQGPSSSPPAPPPRRRWRRWLLAAGVLAALPVPLRVGGGAELAALRQRQVYAELAGTIVQVAVHDNSLVDAGDELARLDDRDLEFEIRSKRHQLEQMQAEAEILRNAAVGDAAKSVDFELARLQAARIGGELEHLVQKRDKLVLRAPVAGVVVTERVDQLQGRRFAAGEVFCQIAPAMETSIVVHLPECDHDFAAPGDGMTVAFAACPDQPVHLRIREIAPIATADAEHGNHFRVYADAPRDRTDLRPGMSGTGYLTVGWRPLVYVLLRKPLRRLHEMLLFL